MYRRDECVLTLNARRRVRLTPIQPSGHPTRHDRSTPVRCPGPCAVCNRPVPASAPLARRSAGIAPRRRAITAPPRARGPTAAAAAAAAAAAPAAGMTLTQIIAVIIVREEGGCAKVAALWGLGLGVRVLGRARGWHRMWHKSARGPRRGCASPLSRLSPSPAHTPSSVPLSRLSHHPPPTPPPPSPRTRTPTHTKNTPKQITRATASWPAPACVPCPRSSRSCAPGP